MRLGWPQFSDGTRATIKEIAVVVLGVLIALAFGEIADNWRWDRETAEARKPLTAELNRNLGRIEFISSQDACVEKRLVDVETWLNSLRTERPLAFNDNVLARPVFSIPSTSIWEVVKTGQIAAHMPLADKLAYSQLYDTLKVYDANQNRQMETWASLEQLLRARTLAEMDIARGLALANAIRYLRGSNSRLLTARSDEIRFLGLKPEKFVYPDEARIEKLCASAL